MTAHLRDTLMKVGLTDKEAKIYLALLSMHEATVSDIARKSRVKRPTAYLALGALEERGLVTHVERRSVLHFRALNPYLLAETQRERCREIERILPDLVSLSATADPRPQMSVFEGPAGLRQMMEDTLSAQGEILCWANMSVITTTVFADYWKTYIRKRVARKIPVRCVFTLDPVGLEFKRRAREELREVYLVPRDLFPFKNEINIYDDKLSIISHQDLIGVVIQNRNIADGQRAIFNLAFEYAKLVQSDPLLASRAARS